MTSLCAAVQRCTELAFRLPDSYFHMFRAMDDPNFPWTGILLGYPINAMWYWCTDQVCQAFSLNAASLHMKARAVIIGNRLLCSAYLRPRTSKVPGVVSNNSRSTCCCSLMLPPHQQNKTYRFYSCWLPQATSSVYACNAWHDRSRALPRGNTQGISSSDIYYLSGTQPLKSG